MKLLQKVLEIGGIFKTVNVVNEEEKELYTKVVGIVLCIFVVCMGIFYWI